jgi:site-specific recombinase XerC
MARTRIQKRSLELKFKVNTHATNQNKMVHPYTIRHQEEGEELAGKKKGKAV